MIVALQQQGGNCSSVPEQSPPSSAAGATQQLLFLFNIFLLLAADFQVSTSRFCLHCLRRTFKAIKAFANALSHTLSESKVEQDKTCISCPQFLASMLVCCLSLPAIASCHDSAVVG
jgi:hypothetical protein